MKSGVMLAKPTGITLDEHVAHLFEQFDIIAPAFSYALSKYERLTGKSLVKRTRSAIKWHDEGKKHHRWQSACQNDFQAWSAWANSDRKAKEPRGKALMHSGVRHEMDSLRRFVEAVPESSLFTRIAIAAHHGKLSFRHESRWKTDPKNQGEFPHLWKDLKRFEAEHSKTFESAVAARYEAAGPRALLQLADHRASAGEKGDFLPKFIGFTYTFPHAVPRGPQKIIEECWDEPVTLLRAPTGSGKTDAALRWAKHQIEQERADRCVIAMPTRFTANALAIGSTEKLSQTGLFHSTAWNQAQVEVGEMARLLQTPLTVTTIDHLCIALSGTREDHHSIFFNLVNSCVVIDEADFYDEFTQGSISLLLKVLRQLQVPVLIMSATLPQSACTRFGVEKIYDDPEDLERDRANIKVYPTPVLNPEDLEKLLLPALEGQPTVIYINTVARAQRLYSWLTEKKQFPKNNVVLYHSRYAEPDKHEIEQRLIGQFGKEAWENGKQRGIAILTQIGELSVNISAEYMISEWCPLDRLVQRIGRLSRFPQNNLGSVVLVSPHKKDAKGNAMFYPAPYGEYHKGQGWEENPALTQTRNLVSEGKYSARNFIDLVNQIYPNTPKIIGDAYKNRELFYSLIQNHWMILPGAQVDADDDEVYVGTERWRCRQIPPQCTVIVNRSLQAGNGLGADEDDEEDPIQFANYREWFKYKQKKGISLPMYVVQKAINDGYLAEQTFLIGSEDRDTERAFVDVAKRYDKYRGLYLDEEEE